MVLLSWLRAVCVPGQGEGQAGVSTFCCEHLRVLVAMHSGLAFLSLHCFTYKMGTVAFTVGLRSCSETWGAVFQGRLGPCIQVSPSDCVCVCVSL